MTKWNQCILEKFYCVPNHSVISNSLRPCRLLPARLLCLWTPPGKNTGEVLAILPILEKCCHFLLQVIFLTQGSNFSLLCLLHYQAGSLPAESLGKPGKKFSVPCIISLWSASNSAAVVVNNWHTSSQISISRPCWVTQIFIKRSFTDPWKCAILKHKISKKNENVNNTTYRLYCVCPEIHMLKSLSPVLHNVAVLVNAVFIEVN